MIKIIEDNKEFKATCENCNKSLLFEQEDVYFGALGCAMITCPICGKEIDTYLEGLLINEKNVEFPVHFYYYGQSEGAVDIKDKKITEWVRQVLKRLKTTKEDFDVSYAGSGNTYVIGMKFMDGSIEIRVMKNYWELLIDADEDCE